MAEMDNFKLRPGDAPPPFQLAGTDERTHSLEDYAGSKLLLVVFSCNHCPYAQAWEGRLVELAREYAPRGMATVVINPNETVNYPDDRFEQMVERAREKGYPFPYLRDDSQEVAHAYGALVTPHPFLFVRDQGPSTGGRARWKLVFQGKLDDAPKEPGKVKERYLKDAIEAALAGKTPRVATSSVIGCSVKWK